MGTRFRRSFKVAPGVRVNLNKKSASISFGPKGLKHTVSTTGKSHTTVGIPGTGLSYTTSSGGKSGAQQGAVSIPAAQRPTSPKSKTVALLLCIFLGFFGPSVLCRENRHGRHLAADGRGLRDWLAGRYFHHPARRFL